ncbi:MAG: SpoIIE family protein phosphatase [Flavobacteriales bacterium]|jgi:serine phosphatase RsbU (regulator of sigma subunit)|nr:SpoIIE family protein phosphatase [Flavobacteriales bacterium]
MNWWGKISNLSVKAEMNSSEIRSLQLTNRLIFISGILASCYIPILIWINAFWMTLQLILLSSVAFVFLFFPRNSKLNHATPIIALAAIYHMATVSIVIPGSQLELYLILIALIQLAAIKNHSLSYLIFGTSIFAYFLSVYTQTFITPIIVMTETQQLVMVILNILGVFLGGFYLVFQIKLTNYKYKNDILKERQEVINKNKRIERQVGIIEDAHKEITDSINYSKRIQNAILPSQKKRISLLPNSFILYKPKDIVAGDFYWVEEKGNQTYFAVGDCTGHGVPGAMMSVICTNALNRALNEYNTLSPDKVLNKTRSLVIESLETNLNNVKDGMDIALCSIEGQTLNYAGANIKLYIIRNNEILEFKPDKQPIGQYIKAATPFNNHLITLEKEDCIYLVTDGYVDQFGGEKLKKFKTPQLKKTLLEACKLPINQQKDFLNQTFENWKGGLEQIDDVCIMGVRI